MTSETVDFRFGKVDLENLICVSSKQALCWVENLNNSIFFFLSLAPQYLMATNGAFVPGR